MKEQYGNTDAVYVGSKLPTEVRGENYLASREANEAVFSLFSPWSDFRGGYKDPILYCRARIHF
jgi:hypothetical protein